MSAKNRNFKHSNDRNRSINRRYVYAKKRSRRKAAFLFFLIMTFTILLLITSNLKQNINTSYDEINIMELSKTAVNTPFAKTTPPDNSDTTEPLKTAANTSLVQATSPDDSNNKVTLDVPLIMQMPELPAGCEITSVTMMLLYACADVNKIDLAIEMPRHEKDVNKGFVGDPFNPVGKINTIFPSALMELVSKYAGNSINMTAAGLDKLKEQIKSGYPVVVWISLSKVNGLHCVCVYGYDDNNIYYNDPLYGEKTISNDGFLEIWNMQKQRAISYTAS